MKTKTKKTLVFLLGMIVIITTAFMIVMCTGCASTSSCPDKAMAMLDQRPDAVVMYGMIFEPGKLGHGQWHVQPRDGGKWLTIDPYNKISESDKPQYRLLPQLEFSAEKYRERYENRKVKK